MPVKPLLRFPDLVAIDLVANWTTLNTWIAKRGFPPGRMLGRSRVWTRVEVFNWIESQPTENTAPLKGSAKKARAEADARRSGSAA